MARFLQNSKWQQISFIIPRALTEKIIKKVKKMTRPKRKMERENGK